MRLGHLGWAVLWIGCHPDSPPHGSDTSPGEAACGDGRVSGDEACDAGAANTDIGACTVSCAVNVCGDGLLWQGVEACDDGNTLGGDGCSARCRPQGDVRLADAGAQLVGGGEGQAAGDLDGDGVADILLVEHVHDPPVGRVWIASGPFAGERSGPDGIEILGQAGEGEPRSAASTGDLNGDGAVDLVIAYVPAFSNLSTVYVLYGPINAPTSVVDATPHLVDEVQVWRVADAGDTDGDGKDDLLVADFADRVVLIRGPAGGAGTLPTDGTSIVGADKSFVGLALDGVGDSDGDGVDDVAMASSQGHGEVAVIYGPVSVDRVFDDADLILTGDPDWGVLAGDALAGVGDVDADGLDDLAVADPGFVSEYVPVGATYVITAPPRGRVSLQDSAGIVVGAPPGLPRLSVGAAGDVDSDARADLLIGDEASSLSGMDSGVAYLMYGDVAGTWSTRDCDVRLLSPGADARVGYGVSGARDYDGDGVDDIVVDGSSATYLVSASQILAAGPP